MGPYAMFSDVGRLENKLPALFALVPTWFMAVSACVGPSTVPRHMVIAGVRVMRGSSHQSTGAPARRTRQPPTPPQKYPDVARAVRANRHRLVTPFDVYRGLRGLTNHYEFGGASDDASVMLRGVFADIPADRTCAQAAIPKAACACDHPQPLG